MNEIIKFNSEFKSLWTKTRKRFNDANIYSAIIDDFRLNAEFISSTKYRRLFKRFGVYVFYIKPLKAYSLEELSADWNFDGYSNYPRIIKSKFSFYDEINTEKWYPFYIGKAENLGSRINEHINHKGDNATYGLKLKDRKFFNPQNIKYSYWEFPEDLENSPKDIKQFLLRHLEKELREKIKPWIGKQ